jgi:hypothetical protein
VVEDELREGGDDLVLVVQVVRRRRDVHALQRWAPRALPLECPSVARVVRRRRNVRSLRPLDAEHEPHTLHTRPPALPEYYSTPPSARPPAQP